MESILPNDFEVDPSTSATKGDIWRNQTNLADLVVPKDDMPMTDTELRIRALISELASVRQNSVGRHSPTTFELGLDSIEAMKLAARLKNVGLKASVSAIMKSPTVGGIAQAVEMIADPAKATGKAERDRPLSLRIINLATGSLCRGKE